MANHNSSGPGQLSDDDRTRWRPNDDEVRADDRDRGSRSTERYGQGQSGYGSGRRGDDISRTQHRSSYDAPAGYDDRPARRFGGDDRFSDYHPYRADRDDEYERETGYRGEPYGHGEAGRGRATGYRDAIGHGGSGSYRLEPLRAHDRAGADERGYTPYRGLGGHRGKGPRNWQRSDERIRESINEVLTDNDHIDATNIEVTVRDGEVTLIGTVEDRTMKRLAEDCVEQIAGVKEVQNHIRIHRPDRMAGEGNGRNGGGYPPPIGERRPRA